MTITVRNLTAIPVEIRAIERFEAPTPEIPSGVQGAVVNITSNFTSLLRSHEPSARQLHENTKSFHRDEVAIRIDAFQTSRTDIKSPENEIVRLNFDIQGEGYRIDCPVPISRSIKLTPTIPKPKYDITAIYLPQHEFLALFSSACLNAWMKELRDESPISALSIPGTHNSPTHYRALPSVRCQAVSPREQLENGVRFFDLRVQVEMPEDREVDNETLDFLEKNPSETVIFSIKREGTGTGTDAQLGRILRDHYAGDVKHWYTNPKPPTLGEARKKIVLIRRFGLEDSLKNEWDGQGWCIDAGTWADNTPNSLCPSGDICVQDFYEVLETENIDKKITYSKDHMARAAECVCSLESDGQSQEKRRQPIYILTASNFWKRGCWPEKIAAKLNPAMVDYLCRSHNQTEGGKKVGDGATGIVVCDWVGNGGDWDLVRCIVGMNAKLEIREHHEMGHLKTDTV
jgi:1-phosphatidylinositol phosphodiesterase